MGPYLRGRAAEKGARAMLDDGLTATLLDTLISVKIAQYYVIVCTLSKVRGISPC